MNVKILSVCFILVALFISVTSVALADYQDDLNHFKQLTPGAVPAPKQEQNASSDVQEQEYLKAALTFLSIQNEEGLKIAHTMADAGTGKSTLTEVKESILKAKEEIRLAYEKFEKIIVPTKFTDPDKKIKDSYGLMLLGCLEILEYWNDDITSHIEKGSALLKNGAIVANSAIDELHEMTRN